MPCCRAWSADGAGSIINQASVGGLVGVGGIAAYAAAKAGVIGLTRQMAVDYGPDNIRVNAVCPGTVPTPLVRSTYEAGGGFASGIAEPLDFDAHDRALTGPLPARPRSARSTTSPTWPSTSPRTSRQWTTGTAIPVDGGMTAW